MTDPALIAETLTRTLESGPPVALIALLIGALDALSRSEMVRRRHHRNPAGPL